MLRQYLLLIRLDNILTSSNILADYFVVVVPATTNILYLTTQMLSSILLYISGIVFNDYFDIDIDLKERKQRTLIIAILSLVVGDIFAITTGLASFATAAVLSATIIGYHYQSSTIANPFTIGTTRFLNVILGAGRLSRNQPFFR